VAADASPSKVSDGDSSAIFASVCMGDLPLCDGWAAPIIASTLFTKRHAVIDIAVGMDFGWSVYRWIIAPRLSATSAIDGVADAECGGNSNESRLAESLIKPGIGTVCRAVLTNAPISHCRKTGLSDM